MKPVQQVLEEELETDDQSVSEERYETPPDEPCVAVKADFPEKEQHGNELVGEMTNRKCALIWMKRPMARSRTAYRRNRRENLNLKPSSMPQRNMPRHWKSSFGSSRDECGDCGRERCTEVLPRLGSEGGR